MKPITKTARGRRNAVPPHRRVLAIVGDTQVGLWVARSLGRAGLGVFVVCSSPEGLAAHSLFTSGAWVLENSPQRPEFACELNDLARQLQVGSIMTIAEGYHAALIRWRDQFEPDIHLFTPSAECFQKATDKDYMHRLCLALGVPVARGTTLDRFMLGSTGVPPVSSRPTGETPVLLRYPLVLRTRQQNDPAVGGTAPWKAAYAENGEQLAGLYQRVRDSAGNVLVQEYQPGVEDHVQVLMHQGQAVMTGEYQGEHHMPLAGGVTVQRRTCRHEDLTGDAVRLLKAIGWEGVAGVQFHYDPKTGRYIFLEINPRFIGGLPTVIMAGFDVPFLLWQSRFEPERMQPGRYRLGLRSRILGGDFNWLLGVLRGDQLPPGQKPLGKASAVGRFLWNCGCWTREDSFWWRDPLPALVDWRSMLRGLQRRRGGTGFQPVSADLHRTGWKPVPPGQSFDIIGNPQSQDKAAQR